MATKKTVKEVIETLAEAELRAEKEAAATEVAEEPKAEEVKVEPKKPKKVDLYIPRGNANDDPNFFIGINGKSYLLPRGKTSMVPPEVKAEYERSVKADEKLNDTMDRLIKEAQTIHHA